MTLAQSIVSPWAAIPLAGIVMLIIAGHIVRVEDGPAPRSRKRIRMANGWVMLTTAALLAAGVGVFDPQSQQRAFVMTWLLVIALLLVCVTLAMWDVGNTLAIARRTSRRLKREAALGALPDVRESGAKVIMQDSDGLD